MKSSEYGGLSNSDGMYNFKDGNFFNGKICLTKSQYDLDKQRAFVKT